MNAYDASFAVRDGLVLSPREIAVSGNSLFFDALHFHGRGSLCVSLGVVSALAGIDIVLQDSDATGGPWTDVVPAVSLLGLSLVDANLIRSAKVNFDAVRRYIRVKMTVSGSTPSIFLSVWVTGYNMANHP